MPAPVPAGTDREVFLRRFLGDPKRLGAVAPSSPFLAREMARAVDPDVPGFVVELGPGTGPVTKALLARGVARDRLVLVEFDPHFCRLLAERFPRSRVVRGDAYALGETLAGRVPGPIAAVVSSLPLLNAPPERRLRLLTDAFEVMAPDGVFVQFTYGLRSPIPRGAGYSARCGAPVLRNLPPASVWTFRRSSSAARKLTLVDHAERLGAQIKARRDATEALLNRQGDKMRDLFRREAAALARRRERRH